MLIKDEDLVVWYLKLHRGPEPSDQLYAPFEHIGQWNEEKPDIYQKVLTSATNGTQV